MNETLVSCEQCGNIVEPTETFCNRCGFPQNGTQDQMDNFLRNQFMEKEKIEAAKKKIKNAKIMLGIVAGLQVLGGLIFLAADDQDGGLVMGIQLIVALLFLGCMFWVDKNPVTAMIVALSIYILIILIGALADPATLVSGILVKVLVIGALARGITAAREAKHIQESIPDYNG